MRLFSFLFSCFLSLSVSAQFTISGKVSSLGMQLESEVWIGNEQGQGVFSNAVGEYELSGLSAGNQVIVVKTGNFIHHRKTIDLQADMKLDFEIEPHTVALSSIEYVCPSAVNRQSPVAHTTVTQAYIKQYNVGVDLPVLLERLPSVVSTSDAGAGIGYTGMRIRGNDATRTNVSVNGVPINDAESHGVFWVNMPDFASNASQIQVQRGIGQSTLGAGSFGASVNIQTLSAPDSAYVDLTAGVGSFNTKRLTAQFGTGRHKSGFFAEGRVSGINSDGYVDRSGSNLKSYYGNLGFTKKKTSLNFITFGGKEVTMQAWNGVPTERLNNDQTGMENYAANMGYSPAQTQNLLTSDRRFNLYTYGNQVDNYKQTHYQLHWSQDWGHKLTTKIALHSTLGAGYYEEYHDTLAYSDKTNLADYNIAPVISGGYTYTKANLIRQRWLDNTYNGLIFNAQKGFNNGAHLILGGGFNRYDGRHFGQVIWTSLPNSANTNYAPYYDFDNRKDEYNLYARYQQTVKKLSYFLDMQYRQVNYRYYGLNNDLTAGQQSANMHFFNPKFGASYQLSEHNSLNFFGGFTNREPNREDYTRSTPNNLPKVEQLLNLEAAWRYVRRQFNFEANVYYMHYNNELVNTGKLNDVGANIRVNVPKSYRLGIELMAGYQPIKNLSINGNLTLSQNKIVEFTEFIDNWDTGAQDVVMHSNTSTSFSPSVIGAAELNYTYNPRFLPKASVLFGLVLKHVGRQYLDNTADPSRSVNPYTLLDAQVNLQFKRWSVLKNLSLGLMVRNVLDTQYESNGWAYRFNYANQNQQAVNLFSQAGRHFMLTLNLRF